MTYAEYVEQMDAAYTAWKELPGKDQTARLISYLKGYQRHTWAEVVKLVDEIRAQDPELIPPFGRRCPVCRTERLTMFPSHAKAQCDRCGSEFDSEGHTVFNGRTSDETMTRIHIAQCKLCQELGEERVDKC